jgi:hypothetical protein
MANRSVSVFRRCDAYPLRYGTDRSIHASKGRPTAMIGLPDAPIMVRPRRNVLESEVIRLDEST